MKDLLLHNWHLKLISLALAAALWAAVARTPTSEIGVAVSLEYQNIPPQTEVYGDAADRVEVRLRGPSSTLRTVSQQDVSLAIDMSDMTIAEEKVLPLTPEMVSAPFGTEVVRVVPAQVRLTIERTRRKSIHIDPRVTGRPEKGFEVDTVVVTPDTLEIEGPESHVQAVEAIRTTAVNLAGKNATFKETVGLDLLDPVIRIPKARAVTLEVRIRHQSK
jgi:YbbR domain-containing protein